MTGYSSIETAIESMRFGAFDYLTKPFQLVEIEVIANRIIEHLCLREDNRRLSRKLLALNEDYTSIDSRLHSSIEAILGKTQVPIPASAKILDPSGFLTPCVLPCSSSYLASGTQPCQKQMTYSVFASHRFGNPSRELLTRSKSSC